MNYTVMSQTQFDGLPILPTIDTTNGGIRLNSNISMAVGAKIEFDGLKFKESVYGLSRYVSDSKDALGSRCYTLLNSANPSAWALSSASISPSTTANTLSFEARTVTVDFLSDVGVLFSRGNGVEFGRCISKSFRVKGFTGAIVYKWLDQVSDYKSTPPNATIVGTLVWGKAGIEANYLTASAFVSAVTAPTEPVTVIVMNASDVVGIPSVINGQPVTVKVWGQGSTDVLYGGISAYYAYRGRDPYLSFDGVDDYAELSLPHSNDLDITFVATKPTLNSVIVSRGSELNNKRSYKLVLFSTGFIDLSLSEFGTSYNVTVPGVSELVGGETIRVTKAGSVVTWYKNGTQISQVSTAPINLYNAGLNTLVGCRYADSSVGSKVAFFNGSVYSFSINGISYIQQGDQSQSTVLPSHPSGTDGALVGGTGWKYVGIDGHFSTNALLLNYINTTTLAAPLNIILLEPMDLTGIPASKDGQPINIIIGYAKKQNMNSYKMALAYSM